MLEFAIFLCSIAAITLLGYTFIPGIFKFFNKLQEKKTEQISRQLDEMFMVELKPKKLILFQFLGPFALGLIGFIFFQNMLVAITGGLVGFGLPSFLIKNLEKKRKAQFHSQLVDALNILSSSLKAGFSLFQAIEALVEEMPAPLSQEFGLILKQNKMGIPLERSFEELRERMPSSEIDLIIAAILIARETGGNLTQVLENLAYSVREKKKIADQIKTLTTQGRWQGVIMSILPVVFAIFVYRMNPGFANIMLNSPVGRILLGYAFISEIIGVILIHKFSKVEV